VKLHDLKPAPGSHKKKTRVGRGIAAGQGKTAGRGTKGQKARAGGNLPAWFEGGQTPLHQRLPKLHGFKNPFRIEYEIVNLGDVARLVELGVLESGELPAKAATGSKARATKATGSVSGAPVTVNQELLRAAGLVRTLDKPLKVLGQGDLSTALFVVADAFSASARAKIEAAGGSVNVLETTRRKTPAIGVKPAAPAAAAPDGEAPASEALAEPAPAAAVEATEAEVPPAEAEGADAAAAEEPAPAAPAKAPAKPATRRRKAAAPADEPSEAGDTG
jgi:large subunit ribosomal protein L15